MSPVGKFSNGVLVRPNGQGVQLFARMGLGRDEVSGGCTSVQFSTRDFVDLANPEPSAIVDYRQRMVADVSWGGGIRGDSFGGSARIDIQHGCILSVNGMHDFNITLKILDPDWAGITIPATPYDLDRAPVVPGFSQWVEAIMTYEAAGNPKETYCTMPRIPPGEEPTTPSPWIRIPRQATSFLVETTEYAAAVALMAEFAWSDLAAGPVIAQRVLNPVQNGHPIWHNVKFVRLIRGAAPNNIGYLTPGFALNL